MTEPLQPIRTPAAQKLEDFKRRGLPVVVWSVAVIVCAVMLFQRTAHHEHIGMARTQEYRVSANAQGTLDDVLVDLYDSIEAGDVVARLDETELIAQLATAQATVKQLGAELEAAAAASVADEAQLTAELRRFQIDEEQRRLDVLGLRVTIEEDEIERERLDLEVSRKATLVETGLLDRQQYDDTRLTAEGVRKRIALNRELLVQLEEEWAVTAARRAQYEAELPAATNRDHALTPLREAINVADHLMQELEIRRKALVLRSPVSGQISQLLCRSGQAVGPGEPILTVAERAPREIVAYLTEAESVRANDRVMISRQSSPSRSAESLVLRVSPTIHELPVRLWRDPRRPSYGRSVVIAGVPALELVPGELVGVRFLGE